MSVLGRKTLFITVRRAGGDRGVILALSLLGEEKKKGFRK